LIQASNLCSERGGRELFSGLALELQAGEALQLVGENGAGKTTLLRIMAGLAEPDEGEVMREVAVSYLGHENGLKAELTPLENLGVVDSAIFDRFNLDTLKFKLTRELSAGEKRRLALARLVMHAKPLWLLDEPFASLDPTSTQIINACMEEHIEKGGGVILTTHVPLNFNFKTTELNLKKEISGACPGGGRRWGSPRGAMQCSPWVASTGLPRGSDYNEETISVACGRVLLDLC